MRSALSELRVHRPRDLAVALQLLAGASDGERPAPLAGGTDLYVYLNAGTHRGGTFLDLSSLRELRGIRVRAAGSVRIGALETFGDIGRHAGVRRGWPALAAATHVIGAAQIQNRATLGGNIANASPAGDSLPVLLAHDAVVVAVSARGERRIPYAELHTGYRTLALAPDELIAAVELPPVPARARTFFRKVGTRAAQSISKVVFAGMLRGARDGSVDHVRLAWGSVAPTPIRAALAESVLLGETPSRAVLERSTAALGEDLSPIDDIRSDRAYRMAVARNVLAQFLRTAAPGFSRA